jgi:CheY-like chemotaxis protein
MDDNLPTRLQLRLYWQKDEYRIAEVSDGLAGLADYTELQLGLILLDALILMSEVESHDRAYSSSRNLTSYVAESKKLTVLNYESNAIYTHLGESFKVCFKE